MPKIGRFTSDANKGVYLRAYDVAAGQWPVESEDIDVETSFGVTRVRRSGHGAGTPLLLLPGLMGNSLFWLPLVAELSRERVVYAMDVMGWAGRCEQTAPIEDEADVAAWVGEVIAGLGADRVHLAGYSLGAWIAAVAAAHRPDRIASLSLLEPAPATFARPSWKVLYKFMAGGIRPTRAKMEKFNRWLSPGLELSEQMWAMLLASFEFRMSLPWARPLTAERFAAITAPVLVLFGGETVVHDAELAAARARTVMPAADIEIYPGVGHEMIFAIPEQVIPRFLEFAAKHEPGPGDR
ncbi:alpha/beta fold hydrolase [Nocardia sp. NPDC057668]|uniref:alpha/beta fold hydrolase n=1 Tax=Nocardia sp. NPDC057668 TaxID=3346202 RepID=UPI00366C45CC